MLPGAERGSALERRVPGRVLGVALAFFLLAASCAPLAGAAKDETIVISRQSAADGGAGGDDDSQEASISADGRYVAFESFADNLSEGDNNVRNVFLRDAQTSTTSLVSRQSAADGGAGADGLALDPSISADGRYVAFESSANNLSADDDNSVTNVFVRDTQTSTTTLVSRQSAADGGAGGDSFSFDASISADGRYVAFASLADNLSEDNEPAPTNVFLRDTQTNTTTLISRQSAVDGGAGGEGNSDRPSISADGRHVAFDSNADNLSTIDVDGVRDVFLRDTQTSTTTLVSRQSAADGGLGGEDSSLEPSISADGRFVAFESEADNLSGGDANNVTNVFLRDTQASTTTLVSRQSVVDGGVGGSGISLMSSVSADGRYVAFRSNATNLSDEDDPVNVADVFVRDTQTGVTILVSRQSAADGGVGGNGLSREPSISADGRFVAFESIADNLSALDADGIYDVFLRDVLGPPSGGSPPGQQPTGEPPSNQFSFGKLKRNKRKGIAILSVEIPGSGELELAENKKVKPAAKQPGAEGRAKLKVKPRGKAKRRLAKRRLKRRLRKGGKPKLKAKVKAEVTYTPTGGTPRTKQKKLKLVRKGSKNSPRNGARSP